MTPIQPAPEAACDYDAILDAVMETARGRWFLVEHARRNRHADTETLLDALRRIERRLANPSAASLPPELADLAAIFALGGAHGSSGLSGEAIADIARESGAAAEAIRDLILSARGALAGLRDDGGDARLCGAVDRAMAAIDAQAEAVGQQGRKIEALAQVVATIRDRVRQLVESASAPAPVASSLNAPLAPATVSSPEPESPPPNTIVIDESAAEADAPPAAFEGGLPLAPVGPGARLRVAIADEERALRELAAASRPLPPESVIPASLAELDRLSYQQRHALFTS